MMSEHCVHYLFGELARFNTTRIWPADQTELKAWLDGWLPQAVQAADEAEPDFAEARALCDAWQRDDRRDEVGVISLPLTSVRCPGAVSYAQLICRVYFNWASAGRVSRTGHAVLLTEEAWRELDYNPFGVPHLVENAAAFSAPESLPFAPPEPVADPEARPRDLLERYRCEGTEWLTTLERIWAGQLPVCVERGAPQWLFELLLLTVPRAERGQLSCVSGPFGLKRRFAGGVHIRRCGDDEAPTAQDAIGPGVECLAALGGAGGIVDCWKVVAQSARELDIAALAASDAGPSGTGVAEPAERAGPPRRRRGRVVVGIALGVALLGIVAWLGAAWWSGRRAGEQLEDFLVACSDGATRRASTIPLLARADALLALGLPAEAGGDFKACVDKLLGLVQARRDVIDGPPLAGEEDIQRLHELITQLSALAQLPHIVQGDNWTLPATDTETLDRRSADWILTVPTAPDRRARLDFVSADRAAQGIGPNSYLQQIAAQVRVQEQEEALRALKVAVSGPGDFDTARLSDTRGLLDTFRINYPDAPQRELDEIARDMAVRFEAGIRPPLLGAYEALKRQPSKRSLAALEQAAAGYETALRAIEGLTDGAGIDTASLLARLRNGQIVEVRAWPPPNGYRVDRIGLYIAPDQCRSQRRFPGFGDEVVCVRLIEQPPLPPLGEQPTPRQQLLGLFSDMLAGGAPDGTGRAVKDYRIPLQTLLAQPNWRDGPLSLQTKIQWPEPDQFTR
jgi:hypothetical protein